jgi:curved DNA-binding protein CbpA
MIHVDFYDRLGVARTATLEEIRSAYRRLARTLHPDVGGGGEEFKALSEAYSVLTSPARRERYDSTGSADAVPGEEMRRQLKIKAVITNLVAAVVMNPEVNLATQNVVKYMLAAVDADLAKMPEKQAEFVAATEKAKEFLRRLGPPKTGVDIIRTTIEEQIVLADKALLESQTDMEIIREVRAMFVGRKYTFEKVQEMMVVWSFT